MYVYGFPGDILTYLYGIWAWEGGIIKTVFPNQTVFVYFLGFSVKFFGPVWGLNVFLLFTFALSLFFSYRFLRGYVRKEAAFVGSLIYSSSQYFIWHAMQNPEIVLASSFIPLLLGGLLNLEIERSGIKKFSLRAVLCGVFLSLIFLSSFYIGYFSLISLLGAFLFFRLWNFWKSRGFLTGLKRPVFGYLVALISCAILTLPATNSIIQYQLGDLNPAIRQSFERGLTRNTVLDLVAYGARPWDYLMPSIYHPLVGGKVLTFNSYIKDHLSYQYWSTFLPERANFLTFTGIILSFIIFVISLRQLAKNDAPTTRKRQQIIFFFCFLALIMFLVSLPPLFSFKGLQVYLPSFFLFKIFPMFRVYARAGVFVLFSVAALSAFSWDYLISRIKNDSLGAGTGLLDRIFKKSFLLTVLLCLLIIFENLTFPPLPVMDVSYVPKVYGWLKDTPGDYLIAEYPKDNSVNDLGGGCPRWLDSNITREYNRTYELYYQTIHHKRVLDYTNLPKKDKITLASLGSEEAYKLLKGYGVAFVIVHTKDPIIGIHPWPYPQENPLDDCWQRRIMKKPDRVYEGFKMVADFDDGTVFKVQ